MPRANEENLQQLASEYHLQSFVPTSTEPINPEIIGLLDDLSALTFRAVPINMNREEKQVKVAIEDPADERAKREVSRLIAKKFPGEKWEVIFYLATHLVIESFLANYYPGEEVPLKT